MNKIACQVDQIRNVVELLNHHSGEIGALVSAITAIADQTNLLALNAAIEAARAGEQGKGFAVVAQEIKKLAEQSGGSAKKIIHLVKEIQQGTADAVQRVESGTEEVKEGTAIVSKTAQAFKEIDSAVSQAGGLIEQAALAAERIARENGTVGGNIAGIAAAAEENASALEEINAAAQMQAATIEEINGLNKSILNTAQGLKRTIKKFKIYED
ncbi:MAG TPA: methyl-accepting chemotaxis protein [Clostridia bacterium]|nr:methyl-accepting chemotaxis protein [Clostridia bacterium]